MIFYLISNFIINIIFISIIIYLIIKLSEKCNIKCSPQNELYLKSKKQLTTNHNNITNEKPDDLTNTTFEKDKLKDKLKVKNKKLQYDKKKCYDCIKQNQELGILSDCAHCGSENYDTGCIPSIVQEGKSNNCVPKELTREQAYWAWKSASNSMQKCNLIHPNYMLEYQKEECKRPDGDYDYYCAYDESDSCSYNMCKLDDYYSYGPQSICDCQKVPNENLPKGYGRECIKGSNCNEFHPLSKAPELLTDPALKKFYGGYGSWMDIPRLNTRYAALISNVQTI